MKLSRGKISTLLILTIASGFVVYQLASIKSSVRKTLAEEESRQNLLVPFEKKVLTPHLSQFVKIIQNADETRDFIRYKNSYFAATSGGLVEYDLQGNFLKHLTVLDGLPESDLECLAVFQNTLFIGTKSSSLLSFDGEIFEQFEFSDRKIEAVTDLTEIGGALYVATSKGGLLKFDGNVFSEIQAERQRIFGITFVKEEASKLFVGTFDGGLWIYETGIWKKFTKAEGLPSNRIVGVSVKDQDLYVATDFGLAKFDQNRFQTLLTRPSLADIVFYENQLLLIEDNGEFFSFENTVKEISEPTVRQKSKFKIADGELFLLSNHGIENLKKRRAERFANSPRNLTDNFISALTFDSRENLWIGTFRGGIDVFNRNYQKIRHLESESLREINFLTADSSTVSAATSSGFFVFKQDFSFTTPIQTADLPSRSINHIGESVLATSKGLALLEEKQLRVVSTAQNLPNNAVYTTLRLKDKLYAGTLGGLAEVQNGRVARVFKDSNSALKTNWVTALAQQDGRIFIGTYGGGVFELLSSGEIASVSGNEQFAVNPNALFTDEKRLYAGTLAGLKIYDLQNHEWQNVRKILPAQTVTALTAVGENIYVGTTNGIAVINKSFFTQGVAQ